MKTKISTLLFALMIGASSIYAFEYNGLSYRPTGEISSWVGQPTCEVIGLASDNKDATVLSIPPDFAWDEKGNFYWPTKIAYQAFKGTNLMYIESLGTIQEIDDYAFQGTSIIGDLSSITVARVGNYAFENCNLLTSVNFIACTDIGNGAFNGCQTLLNAVFPLVDSIGQYAFYNCKKLTHFELPITLQYIGRYAFAGCQDMDDVSNLSELLLHTIPYGCFQGCEDLQAFHFPDCVTRIEDYAFDGCSSLEKISLPDDVRYVGSYAFRNCKQAELAYLHGKYTEFSSNNVFSGCTALKEVRLYRMENSVPFYKLFPDSKESLQKVKILEGSTSIGKNYTSGYNQTEFGNYTQLSEVEIPEGVHLIGPMAFQNCTALKSITLPQSLDTICAYAFDGSGLQSVVLPNKVTYLGYYTFSGCTSLKRITWSSSLTSLPWYVCDGCTAMQEVNLPKSITSIGRHAFQNCTALASVTINGKQTEWETDYFTGCPNIKKLTLICDGTTPALSSLVNSAKDALEEVTLLKGSTHLGTTSSGEGRVYSHSTLANMSKLRKVVIPEGVSMIGYQAFEGDAMLKSINLPQSLETIGGYAFKNCGIEKIVLPGKVKTISESTFQNCKDLKEVGFSSKLETIAPYAFSGCSALENIILPFSVSSIGRYAFEACTGVTDITIGDRLTRMEDCAFKNCSSVSAVTCYTAEPVNISSGSYCPFSGIDYSTAVLYVPANSVEKYTNANGWRNFARIRPIGVDYVETNGVEISTTETTATISWPYEVEAEQYHLIITGPNDEIVCEFYFDFFGDLIEGTYKAPKAKREDGYMYVVSGLESATTYTYTITLTDEYDAIINTYAGSFTTAGEVDHEGTSEVHSSQEHCTKILRDGRVLIQKGDKTYTAKGVEVK